MKRMKTFLKYLIILVALYFVSNVLIDYILYRNYSEIDTAQNSSSQIEGYNLKITSAKATNTNGQIHGTITKNDDGKDGNNFLKIDFFNKRNQLMGTEYLDIRDLLNRTK